MTGLPTEIDIRRPKVSGDSWGGWLWWLTDWGAAQPKHRVASRSERGIRKHLSDGWPPIWTAIAPPSGPGHECDLGQARKDGGYVPVLPQLDIEWI